MSIKDKIMIWIYHKGNQIDEELQNNKIHCRFAPLDSVDHFELMHSQTRLNAWKEFLDELYKIIINCK